MLKEKETYTERIHWKTKQVIAFTGFNVMSYFLAVLFGDSNLVFLLLIIASFMATYAFFLSIRIVYHFYKARKEPSTKKKNLGFLTGVFYLVIMFILQ